MEQFVNLPDEGQQFLKEWYDTGTDVIIAHTSGSTGLPKQIALPKRDMVISATATCRYFGINSGSVIYCPLSVNYIAGKMMIVRAIVSGASLVFETPSNLPLTVDPGVDIDLIPIVPSQSDGLLSSPYLHKVRNVIVGGASIPATLEKRLSEAPFNAFATYGMTETCSHVALRRIIPGNDVYEAMPGVLFGTDSRGCLVICAPEYSFGELTTNDLVELIDGKRFRWLGRYDNVINTGGLKVFPEEIERKLSNLLSFNFYIVGVPDEKWGSRVVMFIEDEAGGINPDDVMDICKKELPRHAVPKEIRFVSRFNRTASNKIIRSTEF